MPSSPPEIAWDFGSAYEFFISLYVLHHPEMFGVRASWAAGVRSRLPAGERKLLEDACVILGVPLRWIYDLPAPKDALTALRTLGDLPLERRLIEMLHLDAPFWEPDPEHAAQREQIRSILRQVVNEQRWQPVQADTLWRLLKARRSGLTKEAVERSLMAWSQPIALGEGLLQALESYYRLFFHDEEMRLVPYLQHALVRAQERATHLSPEALFVELSQGIQPGDRFRAERYCFVPAFWSTPLIFFERLSPSELLVLFGARPPEVPIIPGETLPAGLVRGLKALADPTRLRILRYLSHASLTPSQLARRLHLRPPTVLHHLNELRLASLVEVTLEHGEKRYTIRRAALPALLDSLNAFFDQPPP